MRSLPLAVSLLLLLWRCSGDEGNTRLQSRGYWDHVSLNGTSHLLFRNARPVPERPAGKEGLSETGGEETREKRGVELVSSRLQSVLPPFAITSDRTRNARCKRDSQTFLKHLDRLDLWALKMHDSSGKLPSGLLNGNVNQFGDFDQCLEVEEPRMDVKGKYCLAYLQIRAAGNDLHEGAFRAYSLIQSHFLFKSKLTDPGHRVPRFSTLNWGLCVPSSCGAEDVESHLRDLVDRYSNGTGFEVEVKVEAEMCQEKTSFKVSTSFFVVSCIFASVVAIAVVATLKDVFLPEESSRKVSLWSILDCFSLKRNGKALVSLSRPSDDIECVHGIRMMNALMLVLSHKSMALFFLPYSNRTSMAERLSQPWTVIARTASLYTDSFIMISGLLTSYSFGKTLKKTGRLDLKNEYLSRLIRIVPPLAAVVLLCTFLLPELGSGPQWNLTVTHHADACKKTWWRNFLFVHNYLGFENMCLTHTHHLGIDTQLFFASPLLVLSLFKWPTYGAGGLVALAAVSTIARYQATAGRNLSFFIYPGISVSQMFDTANFSYIIPFHRLTAYLIGVFLGYALRTCGKDYRMKSHYLRLGWTLTFSFLSYILTKASEMNHPGYVYDSGEAAVYAALAPIAWCLFFGWLTFVSHIGRGGLLGKVLSSKYCLIWTRLSYAVYLTQFPVFFFNVGLQRYPQQYSFFLLVNVLEYGCVFLASVALTLLFDMPFGNLRKLFISR